MKYIQRKDLDTKQLETVDEFDDPKVAKIMLKEYQVADPSARYYISSRPTRCWRR